MRYFTYLVALLLVTVCGQSGAVVKASSTSHVLAKSTLLGMQLAVQNGLRHGKFSPKSAECVLSLDEASFNAVFDSLLAHHFTPAERTSIEEFFASSVGQKYARHGVLQIYAAAGVPLPEPLPNFSNAESVDLENFSKTSVGDKLIWKKVLQDAYSRRQTTSRVHELLKSCDALK